MRTTSERILNGLALGMLAVVLIWAGFSLLAQAGRFQSVALDESAVELWQTSYWLYLVFRFWAFMVGSHLLLVAAGAAVAAILVVDHYGDPDGTIGQILAGAAVPLSMILLLFLVRSPVQLPSLARAVHDLPVVLQGPLPFGWLGHQAAAVAVGFLLATAAWVAARRQARQRPAGGSGIEHASTLLLIGLALAALGTFLIWAAFEVFRGRFGSVGFWVGGDLLLLLAGAAFAAILVVNDPVDLERRPSNFLVAAGVPAIMILLFYLGITRFLLLGETFLGFVFVAHPAAGVATGLLVGTAVWRHMAARRHAA